MSIVNLRQKLSDPVILTQDIRLELEFWSKIESHKNMNLKQLKPICQVIEAFSDASMNSWATKFLDVVECGKFLEQVKDRPIYEKEYLAFLYLVRRMPHNSRFMVHLDNKAVVDSFKNNIGGTPFTNEILKEILMISRNRDCEINCSWIDTSTMKDKGCDLESRLVFEKSKNGLSQEGASYIKKLLGTPEVDIYSSYSDNIFNCNYGSIIHHFDDPKCLRLTGSKLIYKAATGKFKLPSITWCYAPIHMLDEATLSLANLKLYIGQKLGMVSCLLLLIYFEVDFISPR